MLTSQLRSTSHLPLFCRTIKECTKHLPSSYRHSSVVSCFLLYFCSPVTKKTASSRVFTHFGSAKDPENSNLAEGKPSSLLGFLRYCCSPTFLRILAQPLCTSVQLQLQMRPSLTASYRGILFFSKMALLLPRRHLTPDSTTTTPS